MSEANLSTSTEIRKPTDPRFHDLEGKTFGKWTVIEYVGRIKGKCAWICRCECGNVKPVIGKEMTRARRPSRSCGCHKNATHGQSTSQLYGVWLGMKNRCNRSSQPGYKDYGGRGITVCDEWRSDFVAFRDWALTHGYEPGLTIERERVNEGYCPENCTWIPPAQQSLNTRRNVRVAAFGEAKVISEWAKDLRCAVKYATLQYRIRIGWRPEKAMTTPARKLTRRS